MSSARLLHERECCRWGRQSLPAVVMSLRQAKTASDAVLPFTGTASFPDRLPDMHFAPAAGAAI